MSQSYIYVCTDHVISNAKVSVNNGFANHRFSVG